MQTEQGSLLPRLGFGHDVLSAPRRMTFASPKTGYKSRLYRPACFSFFSPAFLLSSSLLLLPPASNYFSRDFLNNLLIMSPCNCNCCGGNCNNACSCSSCSVGILIFFDFRINAPSTKRRALSHRVMEMLGCDG